MRSSHVNLEASLSQLVAPTGSAPHDSTSVAQDNGTKKKAKGNSFTVQLQVQLPGSTSWSKKDDPFAHTLPQSNTHTQTLHTLLRYCDAVRHMRTRLDLTTLSVPESQSQSPSSPPPPSLFLDSSSSASGLTSMFSSRCCALSSSFAMRPFTL